MAELTPLDEKLAEVLGLAKAAETAVDRVKKMDGAEQFEADLARMRKEAEETARRTDDLIDGLEGRKTAIREKAQETKSEAEDMCKTYLSGEEEALDGFEFLIMAESAELGHWEIVQKMARVTKDSEVSKLADWAVPLQEQHYAGARAASLVLAESEAKE